MMVLRLQDHFPLRITDWLLASILTTWGLAALAVDPVVWQLHINHELGEFASQDVWGSVTVALGMIRLTALFINGALRRSPHARAIGSFLTCFVWLQLTLGVFTAPMSTISAFVYPWLLIADFYNVFRASQDAKFSDMKAMAIQRRPREDAHSS